MAGTQPTERNARERSPDALRAQVTSLQQALREMEAEREAEIRRRRRQVLLMGLAVSLLAHITLMMFLTTVRRGGAGPGDAPQPVSYEFAIVQEEELTELETTRFAELAPETITEFEDFLDEVEPAELAAEASAPELELATAGSVPILGGAGEGGGVPGLAGGGAGTSFFGISSQGTRFGYIVDISGSMGQTGSLGPPAKIVTAMRELGRSIGALPDFAHFYILLFASKVDQPPMQRGWMRARRSSVRSITRWLEEVTPGGGTEPTKAFEQIFALDVRPDVVFFLTDGQISSMSAEFVEALNSRGKKVVINTIAFGDPSSQDLLKEIARASGGVYRFVP